MPVGLQLREISLDDGFQLIVVVEPDVIYRGVADPLNEGLGLTREDSGFGEDTDSEDAFDAALGKRQRG